MKLLKLREDRIARVIDAGRVELFGPRGKAVVEIDDATEGLVRRLREGIATNEVSELPAAARAFVNGLAKHDFLIAVRKDATRTQEWIAHATPNASALERLETSSVVILGCGGTGSIVADHLVRVGVRHFVLIDNAVLDLPDLNRQLPYRAVDIGRKKVTALAWHLRQFGAQVQEADQKLDSEQTALEFSSKWKADLVYCCADTPPLLVQVWASRFSSFMQCPVVFGSAGISDYVVGPLLVSEDDKYAFCVDRMARANSADAHKIIFSSICINNTMAAVEQAWLGIRYLLCPNEVADARLDNVSTIVNIFGGTRKTVAWAEKTARESFNPMPD